VPQSHGHRPLIYAHRGNSRHFPENTMASFRSALAVGADGLEFDVHASSDGQLVVIHDYDLSRTTSGSGLVHERDLQYVQSLSAGAWFDESFASERVPLLTDVLALDVPQFELEVKGLPTLSLVISIAEAVRRAGVVDRVKFTSFHMMALAQLRIELPSCRCGLFSPNFQAWMNDHLYEQIVTETAAGGMFDVVHIPARHLPRVDVKRLQGRGLIVQTANPETDEDLAYAVDCGVDVICTDDPGAAIRYLEPMRSAMLLIVTKDGRLLLHHRDNRPEVVHPGCWAGFGGAVEDDETIEEALRREVQEEIGIEFRAPILLTETVDVEGDGRLVSLFYVVADVDPGQIHLHEGAGLGVHALSDLNKIPLTPFVRRAIDAHLAPLILQ
jgi:glycerophosphoryl diester phosphodiesterase